MALSTFRILSWLILLFCSAGLAEESALTAEEEDEIARQALQVPQSLHDAVVCRLLERRFKNNVSCNCQRSILPRAGIVTYSCETLIAACKDPIGGRVWCSRPTYTGTIDLTYSRAEAAVSSQLCAYDSSYTNKEGTYKAYPNLCIALAGHAGLTSISMDFCQAILGDKVCEFCGPCPGIIGKLIGGIKISCGRLRFCIPFPGIPSPLGLIRLVLPGVAAFDAPLANNTDDTFMEDDNSNTSISQVTFVNPPQVEPFIPVYPDDYQP